MCESLIPNSKSRTSTIIIILLICGFQCRIWGEETRRFVAKRHIQIHLIRDICFERSALYRSTFYLLTYMSLITYYRTAKVSEEVNRKLPARNTTVQLLTLYTDPVAPNMGDAIA